jgi:DNA-binding CsgD family transcriptional regulator/pimeloyl-ACP methyl ester carboxylesterase
MDAPPVQYVKTSDGYDIAYCVSGEGRPFVLLWDLPFGSNELLWSQAGMRGFFESLASRFRLVQLDARGTGSSSRGLKSSHVCEDYVLDLEAVADHLGLDDFLLFGTVFTAHPIIRYAARHSERVAGVQLLNPVLPSKGWADMKNWEGLYTGSWNLFLRNYAQTFFPGNQEEGLSYCRTTVTQADFLLIAHALEKSSVEDLLPRVKVPGLVLSNREPINPVLTQAARAYASLMPSARLVLFDGEQNREIIQASGDSPAPVIPVIDAFAADLLSREDGSTPSVSNSGDLSARELEVLKLLAQGKSNPQIAEELFITRNTVQNHVSSILIKLNLQNRAQAAVYAKEHGIV